ncbi:ArsI/CadI family heavy metal resistance metalloenzyme [Streptomyces sp900116325]|uniref:ArsI/CadI family heavy metal resistance metalloenzyme n=1 Tax=Streptomyces sp. 900116325 TaxID=3154295 RepID=UPI0033A4D3B5
MSRAQLALRVSDLEASITFYSKLFGTEPAKRRAGYANFAIAEPPLKLVLIEGEPGQDTRMDHLGVEVETVDQVNAATSRLKDAGLATFGACTSIASGRRGPHAQPVGSSGVLGSGWWVSGSGRTCAAGVCLCVVQPAWVALPQRPSRGLARIGETMMSGQMTGVMR